MGDNVVELDEVVIDSHADAAAVKACLGPALMTRSAGGIDHCLLLQSKADLHGPDSSQFHLPDSWPLLFYSLADWHNWPQQLQTCIELVSSASCCTLSRCHGHNINDYSNSRRRCLGGQS